MFGLGLHLRPYFEYVSGIMNVINIAFITHFKFRLNFRVQLNVQTRKTFYLLANELINTMYSKFSFANIHKLNYSGRKICIYCMNIILRKGSFEHARQSICQKL